MKTPIHLACETAGHYVIASGEHTAANILPKLLDALRVLSAEAHQQVTMPGCGFALIPSDAIADESHDFWHTDTAADALRMICEALEEHAPDDCSFEMQVGPDRAYGFYRRINPAVPCDPPCGACPGCQMIAAFSAAALAPDEPIPDSDPRPCYTATLTPDAVVKAYARKHCGEQSHFPMTIVSQREWTAIAAAFNVGIDSHLEALTESTADNATGQVRIHVDELHVFCRRLQEYADKLANEAYEASGGAEEVEENADAAAAEQLRSCIIDAIGIEEV